MAGGPEGGGSRRLEAGPDPHDPALEGADVLRGRGGGEGVPQVDPDLGHPVHGDRAGGRLRALPHGLEDLVPVHGRVAVDHPDPLPGAVPHQEAEGDPLAGLLDGGDEAKARGQVAGDRGGESAPAPVEVLGVAVAPVLRELAIAVQEVDELSLEVPALHEDRRGAELRDRLRGDAGVREGAHPLPGQTARLEPVRCDDGGPGEEVAGEGCGEVRSLKRRAHGGDHHGVHNEGELRPREFVRHRPHDVRGVQHPGLRGPDVEVLQDRSELGPDLVRGDREDGVHGARVLGRDRRDHGGPVHADRGEALQVRLDPRPASGVAPRDREGCPHVRRRFSTPP